MQTYTYGATPDDIIRAALEELDAGSYKIQARGIDATTLDAAVCSDGEWTADEMIGTLAALDDLSALEPGDRDVRRALERRGETDRYSAEEIIENAAGLRTSILETLGIEEI